MRRKWSCTENDAAFPSGPVSVLGRVQGSSDMAKAAEAAQGASLFPFKAAGGWYSGQMCRWSSPFETDPVSTCCAPGAAFCSRDRIGMLPELGASRRWLRIHWNKLHHLVFKPCTRWESWRRGVSDSTAQRRMCFHYTAHLKPRRRGPPAQEDCALKGKRGRCLATCVHIVIRQCTL